MGKKLTRLIFVGIVAGALSQPIAFSSTNWIKIPDYPIALTFDDGPRPGQTLRLLNLLKKYEVKATFFVVGKMAIQDPADIRSMAAMGHEVANHTWNHPPIRSISADRFRWELDKTRNLIDVLIGKQTFLFRAPGGTRAYLENQLKIPAGYRMVLWNVHSGDQTGISSQAIERRILSSVKGGDIVLMHNGLTTTMEALDHMIPILKARGFRFVTVSELEQDRFRHLLAIKNSEWEQG